MGKKKKSPKTEDSKNIPKLDGLSGFNLTIEARDFFWRLTREDPNVEESQVISKIKFYAQKYYDLVALSIGIAWKKEIPPQKIHPGAKTHGINAPQIKTEHVDIYRILYLLKKYQELNNKKGGENIDDDEFRDLLYELGDDGKVRSFAEETCNGAFYRLKNLIEGATIPNINIVSFLLEMDKTNTD